MSRFTVRPYEPGDEEGILALFNAVFGEGNPAWVPRTMDTWRHIFLANPHGVEITVAVDADGEVVANYSGIPAVLWVKDELRPCVQGVDTAVHADWRGLFGEKSVYRQVTAAFTDRWCRTGSDFYNEILYGVPNRQAFAAGSRVIGYKAVHRPLVRTVKEFGPEWIDELEARTEDVVASESDWSDLAEVAALFAAHRHEIPMALDRGEAYLGWRYRDWPGRPYRALVARVCQALSRSPRLLTLPTGLLRALLELAGTRDPALTGALATRMHQDLVFDASAAGRDFGFAPERFLEHPERDLAAA